MRTITYVGGHSFADDYENYLFGSAGDEFEYFEGLDVAPITPPVPPSFFSGDETPPPLAAELGVCRAEAETPPRELPADTGVEAAGRGVASDVHLPEPPAPDVPALIRGLPVSHPVLSYELAAFPAPGSYRVSTVEGVLEGVWHGGVLRWYPKTKVFVADCKQPAHADGFAPERKSRQVWQCHRLCAPDKNHYVVTYLICCKFRRHGTPAPRSPAHTY